MTAVSTTNASAAPSSEKILPRSAVSPAAEHDRTVLSQLLHALNQPLTGLQCSMEVALAAPRSAEHYVATLREGLELTARMRALVGAIHEVVRGEEKIGDAVEVAELTTVLRAVAADLAPVAEARQIAMVGDLPSESSASVRASRSKLGTAIFRLLESVLGLAQPETALRVAASADLHEPWLRVEWSGTASTAHSVPELGLLVAQAAFEQLGAKWQRTQTEGQQNVTVRFPGFAGSEEF